MHVPEVNHPIKKLSMGPTFRGRFQLGRLTHSNFAFTKHFRHVCEWKLAVFPRGRYNSVVTYTLRIHVRVSGFLENIRIENVWIARLTRRTYNTRRVSESTSGER